MKFIKGKGAIFIYSCIGLIIASVVSPIIISWGSYTLETYYKLPVNPNAVSILAGITGMWGSIFGGVIGGSLTLVGVLYTIGRERKNAIRIHFQSQLGAAIFITLVIDNLMKNIIAAKDAIENILEKGVPYGATSREDLYKTFTFQFIDRYHDWAPYIEKIQDVNLQKDLWIIYKNFIKIEESVHRDTSDLHNEKQEVLSELPENFLEKPLEIPTLRQKFLVRQLDILTAKIALFEIMRKNEWMSFEHIDYLGQIESVMAKLNKLIDDIDGTFKRKL